MMRNKFKTLRKLMLLGLILVGAGNVSGQNVDSAVSSEESIAETVKLAPCKKEERLEAVRKLFASMGAKDDEMTVEKFNKDKVLNLVVRKKGKSEETIVVGAHYDKTEEGCGAIDNWTGITVVAHLYKTLRSVETEKSYVFVAFDQEEVGLLGSDAMAKAIPKENRERYCAMVNFDSFGFAVPMALQNASSSKMIKLAKKLATDSKFKFIDVFIEGANSDSSSFKIRDIPSISFGGLSGNWQEFLHTRKDKIENVNFKSVYFGYRFGLIFISNLDSSGCGQFR